MTALLSDELWEQVEPLLPKHKRSPKGGREPVEDRKAMAGILFILESGSPWRMVPKEEQYASASTCWRRMQKWTKLKVWPKVHRQLLNALGKAGETDLSRAVIDSSSVRAVLGGRTRGRTPRIVGKKAANAT
jgi:transposase